MAVTGADETTATHLLEASEWDLEQGINLYVETQGTDSHVRPAEPAYPAAQGTDQSGFQHRGADQTSAHQAQHFPTDSGRAPNGGDDTDFEAAVAASLRDAGDAHSRHVVWDSTVCLASQLTGKVRRSKPAREKQATVTGSTSQLTLRTQTQCTSSCCLSASSQQRQPDQLTAWSWTPALLCPALSLSVITACSMGRETRTTTSRCWQPSAGRPTSRKSTSQKQLQVRHLQSKSSKKTCSLFQDTHRRSSNHQSLCSALGDSARPGGARAALCPGCNSMPADAVQALTSTACTASSRPLESRLPYGTLLELKCSVALPFMLQALWQQLSIRELFILHLTSRPEHGSRHEKTCTPRS